MREASRSGGTSVFELFEPSDVPAQSLRRLSLALVLFLAGATSTAAQTHVLTYRNDNARTGQNVAETILTSRSVNAATFGKVGFLSLDGRVDAQPLFVSNLLVKGIPRNVLFVATEHDSVYAFDADTLGALWKVTLLGTGEATSDHEACSAVTPEIGISSTPVIDLDAGLGGAIFVVAKSKDASGNHHQRLHALDLATGTELPGSPADIQPTFAGESGPVAFDPSLYVERAGLLLLNGTIYTSWAPCDGTPESAWTIGYGASTLQQVALFNFASQNARTGAWMSGLAGDSLGNVYFASANGASDAVAANGRNSDTALVRISPSGGLTVLGYFAPQKASRVSVSGPDVRPPLLLPEVTANLGNSSNIVSAAKDGTLSIASNAVWQDAGGIPAYFNGMIYYAAAADSLKALSIADGRVLAAPSSTTSATIGNAGTGVSVSADGPSNGIVWALHSDGGTGVLEAYDAATLSEVYNSNQASPRDRFVYNGFATPTVANGSVYLAAADGIAVFGLLDPSAASPSHGAPSTASVEAFTAESPTLATTSDPSTIVAYMQSASGNDHYSTATAAAKFANAVTASDVIAVLCAWTGTTQTLTRVSDTQGNAYTIVDNPTSGSYGRAAMAYAVAGVSGPDTVTCTFSSASMGKSVVAHEIGGVNAAVPLDGHKMTVRLSPGTGANAISSGAITTTVNGDYLLGFTFNSSSNQADWNAGTGFTRRQDLRVASYTVASEDATQSAAGAAAATFTATAGAVGEFITGILALQPRQGPAPTLVSIAVTPVNPSIGNGSTQPFTATGTYSDSSTQNLTGAAAWTSSNTGAATVSSTGVATGVGVGTTTIQAAFGGVTGSTTLTVTAPVITVAVSPASASVPVTGKQQFTATVTNDSQNAGVTWNLSGAGCSGSTCGTLSTSSSSSGTPITYTAPSSAPTPQTVTLTATSVSDPARTAAATITITLADTAPMYIDFEGATDGTTINASVMAASTHCGNGSWSYFTDSPMTGMTISTTAQRSLVAPVTTCGTRYTDSAGTRGLRYDMSQVGKYAAYHWNTTSSSASVGFYYKIDVVDSNWYSVFAITAQGHDYVMLHMHGGAMYIETWAGITDPIPISPKTWYWVTMQYNAGATHYMRVYDATTWALLGSVSNVATGNWTPDGIEIGRTGSEPGYPAAYWYYDNFIVDYVNGTFPIVQGTPTALTSIAVTPSNPSIAKGTTQPFTATGTYSDGTTQNLTATVAWTSSNTSVATISGGGVASGTGVGTATIQAKSGSVTGSTTLTVTAPVLSSIAVNPPSPSIPVGAAQAFTATGTYSDGSTQNLTGSVTWSSSNAAVATMSGAVASAVGIGNSTIQAASGPVTGSTTLTVTAALSSIAVTPTNPSIPKGTSQSFVATATYSDGSTSNVTGSVSWTSTNSSVATMSGALAFAVSTGSTTIQATSGSVTGSTTLTVTPALLSSIAVTPANPTIVVGSTQAFTATGTYSDGTTQNLTATATWSSSNTLVATIASTGVATGVAAGTTTIGAASGAITGSTTLTISSAAAITYVQSASGNDHYSTATAAAKFANAVTASDVIAVLCAWTGTTQTLTRVSDTQGNAYTIVDNPTSGSYGRAAMAYAVAGVSGPDTVTCTFSSASMGKSVVAHEIGGVNAAVPLDGHKMTVRLSPGTGANAISSGAITTTVNGDYLLGFTFNSSSNQADWNAGTGFTRRQDLRVASYTVASEDAIQSAAGAAAATFTATAGAVGEFITGILALRPR